MDNHSLPKSPAQPSGLTQVPDNTYRRIKAKKITRHLTCPLCENIFKEATTINECNHTCKLSEKFVYFHHYIFFLFLLFRYVCLT